MPLVFHKQSAFSFEWLTLKARVDFQNGKKYVQNENVKCNLQGLQESYFAKKPGHFWEFRCMTMHNNTQICNVQNTPLFFSLKGKLFQTEALEIQAPKIRGDEAVGRENVGTTGNGFPGCQKSDGLKRIPEKLEGIHTVGRMDKQSGSREGRGDGAPQGAQNEGLLGQGSF